MLLRQYSIVSLKERVNVLVSLSYKLKDQSLIHRTELRTELAGHNSISLFSLHNCHKPPIFKVLKSTTPVIFVVHFANNTHFNEHINSKCMYLKYYYISDTSKKT